MYEMISHTIFFKKPHFKVLAQKGLNNSLYIINYLFT